MAVSRKSILVGAFLVVSIFVTSFAFYFWQIIYAENILIGAQRTPIIIPKGSTFDDLQDQLYNGGYVNDLLSFSFLARIMKYDKYMKPGLYMLEPNMSNMQAIRLLRSGAQTPTLVTFSDVRQLKDLAPELVKNVDISVGVMDSILTNPAVARDYGFTRETFISMFIPNTYEVYYTITPKELLDRMKTEYDRFWNDERKQKAREAGLSEVEVSIMASIVEAEQRIHADEWPRIAGLYLNRLEKGYRLDSDPTLVFAHQDFTINRVLNRHKEIDSPYNTYKNYGLPPGPIRCPSIGAIDAVLDHEDHNLLYMCARADFSGYHEFATNLQQHNINARAFQRALNQRRIYN